MGRFESPFIFKIRFYKPEGVNASKNAAHIKYIGTRPGVAVNDEHSLLTENSENLVSADEREWFNEDHEHMDIKHDDGEAVDPGTAIGHIKYAGERPGSHGLFDQESSNPNMLEIQKELSGHKGMVWRSILSLKENDAIKLGFIDKERWEDTLRATVTEAAKHMKIKESNLRWVAAYHAEEGHPHAHLVMWEKEPMRDRGMVSKGEKEDIKRTFMREIYANERTRLHQEKTANRDLMRDLAKDNLQDYVKILKEVKHNDFAVALEQKAIGNVAVGIAPKIFREDEKIVMKGLQELASIMPEKGRMAFAYMPEEVKQKSLEVANQILSNSFGGSMEGYMKAVEEQTRLHSLQPEKIELAQENAYKDIQKRIANLVIRGAGELNRTSYLEVDNLVKEKVLTSFRNATGKPGEEVSLDRVVKDFSKVLLSTGMKEVDVRETINDWKIRSKVVMSDEELDKAIRTTIKTFEENEKWGRSTTIDKKQFTELTKVLKIDSPYLWKSTIPKENTQNMAKNVWKAMFNAIEKERMQGQAQAEMQRREIQQQQLKNQRKLQGHSQEEGRER